MMTEGAFVETAALLAERNRLSIARAEELLSFIGDTPELADDGRVIVRDDEDREIARVWYPDGE